MAQRAELSRTKSDAGHPCSNESRVAAGDHQTCRSGQPCGIPATLSPSARRAMNAGGKGQAHLARATVKLGSLRISRPAMRRGRAPAPLVIFAEYVERCGSCDRACIRSLLLDQGTTMCRRHPTSRTEDEAAGFDHCIHHWLDARRDVAARPQCQRFQKSDFLIRHVDAPATSI
jgi:hypothetical protein